MSKPLFWIIDEEWNNYNVEIEMLNQKYPGCTIKFSGYDYQDDLEEFGKNCDAILCQVYADIPRAVIEKLNKCKAIAIYAGGFDRVDVVAAKEKGIKVTNVSGYCKEDLADYIMAAIYFFNKQLAQLSKNVKTSPWGAEALSILPTRISSSTGCILGFGRIGQEIAKKLNENHMNVIAYDPFVSKEDMEKHNVTKVEWLEAFEQADYISVNMILNEETLESIGEREFDAMKNTACIINTSRGQIISEPELIKAVKNNKIGGAMLDVIAKEPPTYEEPIFNQENIYITPHVSYASTESFKELIRRTVENAIMGYEGEISSDLVNG